MKVILKIAKSELSFLFYSPIAWLILVLFTFQTSMHFADLMEYQIVTSESRGSLFDLTEKVFTGIPQGIIAYVQQYLYLYIPLLTMGLMSKEKSSGTIKLLFSSPITNTQIILGKYFAMMAYSLILIAIMLVYVVYGAYSIQHLDLPYIFSGLLGIYLLTCAYAAVGLFMSCLSSYQIAAAMGTLVLLTILNMIGTIGQDIPFVRDITYWLSIRGRSNHMVQGLICSEDVFYFVIVAVVFIMLAIYRLSGERKKLSRQVKYARYVGIVVVAVMLGYISTIPWLMSFYDATMMEKRTLTPNSREIMEKMDGGLTITTYVNLLEKHFESGLPKARIGDKRRFEEYIRFKPEIKMKYVYYYDEVNDPSLEARFPNTTLEEKARKLAENLELDFDMFLSPEEIRQQIDLSGEQNRFVRLIERENGQKTFLRMYNDMAKFPSETEISAAMKRLVRPAIKIAYLSGHGERDINKQGDQGYFLYTQDITFRNSLVNNGFDVMTLNLQEEGKIPDDLDILFISELRQPLSSEEQAEIARYIAEGGNLIVACEAGSQDHINPLLAPFGISFLPGRVMQKSENFAPSLVFSQMSKEMEQASGDFSWMNRWKYRVPMPNVVGIQYTATENVTVTPFMHTITTETCWQELETTDYMAKDAVLNTEAGETAGTFHTSVLVSRKLSNKEQRLWVVGDADLFSNGELMQRRRGVLSGENKRVMEYAMQFMTEGNFPVDTDRKGSPDRGINIGLESLMPIKVGFMGVFPALLAIFGIAIQIRRKRK